MKRKTLLLSFTLGILADLFFWHKSQGISFFLFILLLLIFSSVVLREKKVKASKKGYYFLIPIGIFSALSFIYSQPFISFLNRALVYGLIGIWAASFENAAWFRFGMVDYIDSAFRLGFNMISMPWLRVERLGIFSEQNENKSLGVKASIRGFALALPVLIIFLFLFASADLAFADNLEKMLELLNIEHLGEYFLRLLLIFLIANAFLGLILFEQKSAQKKDYVGEKKPFIKPFLGTIESGIILTSVLLLFITFIAFQFRYFFLNQTAITQLGYTYSEYARQGFGELIAVSVISLGLILSIDTITASHTRQRSQFLSWLHSGLILGNLIILISAFMRLFLYESAYGFTRLRTFSHLFIIWLGILLLAVGVLVWLRKIRLFTNIMIVCVLGFVVSLNILNTDAMIVNQNIKRTQQTDRLDGSYLGSLSTDAVPALVRNYVYGNHPSDIKNDIGAAIICLQYNNEPQLAEPSWQSFTISKFQANKMLASLGTKLESYEIKHDDWMVSVFDPDGIETACFSDFFFD